VAAAPSPAAPPVPVGAETGPVNFDILAVPPAAPAATLPPALNLAPEPVFDVDAAQRAAFAMVQQLLAATLGSERVCAHVHVSARCTWNPVAVTQRRSITGLPR
jgi:hypothetical protein